MTKKLSIAIASSVLVAFLGFQFAAPAFAGKVDCDAVMSELNGGKKPADEQARGGTGASQY